MRKLLAFVVCVIWIGLIFSMGMEDGSSSVNKTYKVVNIIKPFFETVREIIRPKVEPAAIKAQTVFNGQKLDKTSEFLFYYIRKMAHFMEYFILALVVCAALFSVKLRGKNALGYILFICLICGVMDEFNQSFINRTSMVSDVLIDFAGSLIGILMYYIFYYNVNLRRLKHSKSE